MSEPTHCMAITCTSINENTQMWEITKIGYIAKDKKAHCFNEFTYQKEQIVTWTMTT
jgi:hypothetical protein